MKYNKLLWKMKVNQLLIRLGLREPDPIWYIGGSDVLPQPLPRAKEREVLEAMKNGDLGAKSTLIEHNLRLVVYIARRFENTGINIEDLISIGTIGLIKAVNTFKVDKNIKLATLNVFTALISPMVPMEIKSSMLIPVFSKRRAI